MEKADFQNELDYGAAVLLSKEMLAAGIIDRRDFDKIERMAAVKYQPVFQYRPSPETEKPPRK